MRTKVCLHRFSISLFVCLALLMFAATFAQAASTTIVISQVYGGGGTSGATYKNDFVELHNVSASPVSLNGMSIQYASATGTGSFSPTPLPNVSLGAGQYFLVQLKSTAAVGADLPTPDHIASPVIDMSGASGKVALVNGTASLGCNGGSTPCSAAALSLIVDLVGYGSANFFEGTSAAPTLSSILSAQRKSGGCTDTDSNGADFTAALPAPRNTASALVSCGGPTAPSGVGMANPGTVIQNITSTVLSVNVSPGQNPTSTGITVTGDLSGIGGSAAQNFPYDSTNAVYSYTTTASVVGSVSIPVTITDDQLRTGTTTIALTVKAPASHHFISEVQGSGNTSPLAGADVEVSAIAVALASNGFYLEEKQTEWDADPATSEGIFVFTSTAPTVTVGNEYKVTGTVQEYGTAPMTVTELVAPSITLLSTGNTLPPAVEVVPDPSGRYDQLERYEGMLVHFGASTVVGPSGVSGTNSNGIFYTVLNGTPRPHREPGVLFDIALPSGMPANYPVFDRNPERLQVNTSACASRANVGVGDSVSEMTGTIGYSSDYTIYACPTITLNQQPAALLPVRAANEFTVGTFNMLSFTADATRLAKASMAIRNVMASPDIIGVEEMKDLTTLQAVADKVSQDGGPTYGAALISASSAGSQQLGLLYRQDRVTDVDVRQIGADAMLAPPYSTYWLNDRPPLVMTANVIPPNGKKVPVTVIVNHLKSLIDVDTVDVPPSVSGDRTRHKRQQQAQYLANLIKQHEDAGEVVVSVGDYNAFEFNDGYVDLLGEITGNPTPADQVLLAGTDLYGSSPHPVDITAALPQNLRYSYVESGNIQLLDHIVASPGLLRYPYHVEVAHNNSEYPKTLGTDATRPERVSDHDMPVAYFTVPTMAPSVSPALLTFAETAVGQGTSVQKVTFTNDGLVDVTVSPTVSGSFGLWYNYCTGTIAPGASCAMYVAYTPQVGGPETGSLSVAYSGGVAPLTVALNGKGVAQIQLTTDVLTFAATNIGSGTGAQRVGVLNRTGTDITIAPTITGSFYISSSSCTGTLAPNTGCYIFVNYLASAAGQQTGQLTVAPSVGSAATVSLTGTGNAGDVQVGPAGLTFAATNVGSSTSSQRVGVLNRTGVGITIAPAISGAFRISINTCTGTIAPNSGCYVFVQYRPTAVGQQTGTLTVTPSVGTAHDVSLTGTGQ